MAGTGGSWRAGPRVAWSWTSCSVVSGTPLGFSGPTRPLNSGNPARPAWAGTSTDGSSQMVFGNRKRTALRLVFDDGKCAAMRSEPAPESVPDGLEVTFPKPATPVVRRVAPSATKRATPASRVMPGRRVATTPTRSQSPRWSRACAVAPVGQNTARPKIARSAGSRVSPANSISAMPIASAGPRLW